MEPPLERYGMGCLGPCPSRIWQSPVRILVLVPAYNPGPILRRTLEALLEVHPDVWLLVDGSADGSDVGVEVAMEGHPGFRVFRRIENLGKGATVLEGALRAEGEGFTHLLCFDSDGQHPAQMIPEFRRRCEMHPSAMIMGEPLFGGDAPLERVYARRLANALCFLWTLGKMRPDSLFGMRIYPLRALLCAFSQTPWARRFDFETEIAVRMVWAGVPVIGIVTPVRYPCPADGGGSHFQYWRDNCLLFRTHARLLAGALLRGLPLVARPHSESL
jgi:glycosyltransferase involved in cell wall biosynthesis